VPLPQGLSITSSLQGRFSRGFAASLAWTMPRSCTFGAAEPRRSRARSHPRLPSSTAQGIPAAWHPLTRLPWGVPCRPLGQRGGVCLEPVGGTAAPQHDIGSRVSAPERQRPCTDLLDMGSAAAEGPWHVLGAAGCWSWVPAPSDSARGPRSIQGVR